MKIRDIALFSFTSIGLFFLTVFIYLTLSSCQPLSAELALKMTPEQITSYKEKGFKVFLCGNGSGPPGSGGITFLIIDKEAKVDLSFSPNCQLITATVK